MPIEDLNAELERLKRGPAGVVTPKDIDVDGTVPEDTRYSYNRTKKLFDISGPQADDSKPVFDPFGSAESVVGGRAPDYSGYDNIKDLVKKPEGASAMDWISMLGTAGLGMAFGRADVGMTNAGAYGLNRAKELEKKQTDYEKQLLSIDLARAQQMAKGAKGTKVKGAGGLDAKTLYKMTYTDPTTGEKKFYRKVDERGVPVPHRDDPVADTNFRTTEISTPDGGKKETQIIGNRVQDIGYEAPQMKSGKTAKDETYFYNDRDLNNMVKPDDINKTQMKLSPKAHTEYGTASNAYKSDPNLGRYKTARHDLQTAITMLDMEGASPLLAAQRFIGMAQDKGRSLTNDEFARMAYLDSGWVDKLKNMMLGVSQGKVGTDVLRAELKKVAAGMSVGLHDLENEVVQTHNKELVKRLGDEYRQDLSFPTPPKITGKVQQTKSDQTRKLDNQLNSAKPKIREFRNKKTGEIKRFKMGYDPETGDFTRKLEEVK